MRAKAFPIRTRKNSSGSISYIVEVGLVNGKRKRRCFKTRAEVEIFASQHAESVKTKGSVVLELSQRQLLDAKDAFAALSPYGVSLSAAIDYYLKHAKPAGGTRTVSEVAQTLLDSKARAQMKPRYLKELGGKFRRFCRSFGSRHINEIGSHEIEEWLHSKHELSPLTKTNYIRDLCILFNYAVEKLKCAAENPVLRIEKPRVIPSDTGILAVEQAVGLISSAMRKKRAEKCDLIPYIAIGLFAGLRSSELEALDWKDVNLTDGSIVVRAENAKTSQRRTVRMSDNLRMWMKCYEEQIQKGGPIVRPCWRKELQKTAKEAGIVPWPQNALRHSFGSYHLAKHSDAGVTSTLMGHRTQNMVHRHYKELVGIQEAALFWQIVPILFGDDDRMTGVAVDEDHISVRFPGGQQETMQALLQKLVEQTEQRMAG